MAKNITMWYEQGDTKHSTDRVLSKEELRKLFKPGSVRLVKQYRHRRTTQGKKKRTKERNIRKSKWIRLY